MIKLSNGIQFRGILELKSFIADLRYWRENLERSIRLWNTRGHNYGLSVAIAAFTVAIENAELNLKSAQQRETKMKAVKKATKPAAKKPAAKKAVKKLVAKKK